MVFADVMKEDDTNDNAYNYIWDMPDLNSSGDNDYPAWVFHCFPQSFYASTGMVPPVMPRLLPSTSLLIHYSFIVIQMMLHSLRLQLKKPVNKHINKIADMATQHRFFIKQI